MRKRLKWHTETNMFGSTHYLLDGEEKILVATNQTENFRKRQKRPKDFYWFRSPNISLAQLATTTGFLSECEGNVYLEVWSRPDSRDASKRVWDASLKMTHEGDVENLAWTLTEIWMKWNSEQEDELKGKFNAKPLKARVTKDGRIRVRATVTSIQDV